MWKSCMKKNLLTISTIIGVILGAVVGIILRETRDEKFTSREIMYINFVGDIFLRMLKALILPLIITSLISAIGSLDVGVAKKLGYRAVAYYIGTTLSAVILGIILVTTIKPGHVGETINNENNNNETNAINGRRNVTTADTILDLVRNMFPPNLIQACTEQYQTVLEPKMVIEDINQWLVKGKYVDGMNILGLVTFAFVFGSAISFLKSESKWTLIVIQEISQIVMKITSWVICFSPIGIFFLIIAKIIELDDLQQIGGKLGFYFLTVCIGIVIHGFVILPLLYFLCTRKNPYKFVLNMGQAMLIAFGTSSSSATLPVTIKQLEEKNKIDPIISRFVLPIGSTINMDGTALYEAVAAIFIAQSRNVALSFADIIVISITATAASIGAAGIPQAGLVTMIMVLDAVGLPAEDVTLIIAVDWLLDRIRTVINVLGDSFGAGIIAHFYQKEMKTESTPPPGWESNGEM